MTFSFGAPAQPAAAGGFGAASTGFGGASTASAFGKPATTQATGIIETFGNDELSTFCFKVLVDSVLLQQPLRAQVLVDLELQQQQLLQARDLEDLVQQQPPRVLVLVDLVPPPQQHKARVLVDLVQLPRVRLQDLVELVRQLLAHQLSAPLVDLVLLQVNQEDCSELKISQWVLVQQRVSQEDCLGPLIPQQQALVAVLVELAQVLVPLQEEHLAVELIQASTTSEPISNNNNNNSRGLRPRALMPRCISQLCSAPSTTTPGTPSWPD